MTHPQHPVRWPAPVLLAAGLALAAAWLVPMVRGWTRVAMVFGGVG